EHKVVIVGLDNAGKTTVLYQFLTKEAVQTSPTIGSNVEQITVRKTHFLVWDIGGQESLRASWYSYYCNTEVPKHIRAVFVKEKRSPAVLSHLHLSDCHPGGGQHRPRTPQPDQRGAPPNALARGPPEGGHSGFGQQTGCERFHDGGGDFAVSHARHHHDTLMACPSLLRTDRRRVRRTHASHASHTSHTLLHPLTLALSSLCLQSTCQSGLDEGPGGCKLELSCSNTNLPHNQTNLSWYRWDIDSVWGQILCNRLSHHGRN
ncbi:unnamed protein product, partial [Tetraodon nigroviridis]